MKKPKWLNKKNLLKAFEWVGTLIYLKKVKDQRSKPSGEMHK